MPTPRSLVARTRFVLRGLCGAAAMAACTHSDTTAPLRALLTVAPARLVMQPGDVQRLALTTRAQLSLTNLGFWIDPGLGNSGDPVPASVDGIGVVTAATPGTATVQIAATADGVDTNAVVPVFVRGIVYRYRPDTARLYFSAPGSGREANTGFPFLMSAPGPVVDTAAVSQAVTWTVADTTVVVAAPYVAEFSEPGSYLLTPRRFGATRLVIRSVAVPSFAVTVPVVVRYCLAWGSHGSAGSCVLEGPPPP